jgi:hypothetical protein
LSLTWIYEILIQFSLSRQASGSFNAWMRSRDRQNDKRRTRAASTQTCARASERTRKQNEQSEWARRQYFFYIRTSVFVIIWRSRSFLSVNRTVKTDTHQKEKRLIEGGDNTISFTYVNRIFGIRRSESVLRFHRTAQKTTRANVPRKVWLVLLRMYISFFWYLTVKFCHETHRTVQEMPHVFYNIRLMFYSIGFLKKLIFVVKRISSYFFNIWKIGGLSQTRGLESSMHFIYLFVIYLCICEQYMLTCNMRVWN